MYRVYSLSFSKEFTFDDRAAALECYQDLSQGMPDMGWILDVRNGGGE